MKIVLILFQIDLLAAARCNMFSHVLSNYQTSFLTFATKVAQTLVATADTMNAAPQYEFCILKELSQSLGDGEQKQEEVIPQDKDQMLFFQVSKNGNHENKTFNYFLQRSENNWYKCYFSTNYLVIPSCFFDC